MERVNTELLVQGTDEWRMARCGNLGASRIADAIAKTKSGWGASRANLMAELIVERITDVPTEGYMNDAMRHGQTFEAEARAAYEFRTDASVTEVGLVRHPRIKRTHASPDGLVGDAGLLEIKCPQSATHIDTLLGKPLKAEYITQMQWQMSCCDRQWCDFASYDPRMPESMRLFVVKVERDNGKIAELEGAVKAFLAELDAKVAELTAQYERRAAA